MGERVFTADKAWFGGFYELALEVGPPSDDRLRAALEALWSHPDLDGCYLDRGCEPADQPRKQPDLESRHLLGVAQLPHGSRVACGSLLIREVEDHSDWLDFYLPMGSLWTAYGRFPFADRVDWPEDPWLLEVDDWLAKVGLWIARSRSFRLGLIGVEVCGEAYAADITAQGIPAERYVGYLWPSGGSVEYHRRTWGETESGPHGP
jgi:hypothetical protein